MKVQKLQGKEEYESYYLNDTVHKIIKDAPYAHNNGRTMDAVKLQENPK